MTHASLFSGIGGFDLAAEWMGWDNIFHCEINEFGRKVLNYYWPESISYEDIKETDFTKHRGTIDVLSGGFPCQPYSVAGKRKGKEDERHLWPEMLRAAIEIQPSYIVGENVGGIISWDGGLVFDEVQTDLEAAGYEVWAYVLPACAVNAPHRRDRVWFIATYAEGVRHERRENDNRWNTGEFYTNKRGRIKTDGSKSFGYSGASADPYGGKRLKRGVYPPESEKAKRYVGTFNARSNGRNTWDNFPTQSPLCSRNDELSTRLSGITVSKHRNESLKAYGNAVVPAVVYEIFKAINRMQNEPG